MFSTFFTAMESSSTAPPGGPQSIPALSLPVVSFSSSTMSPCDESPVTVMTKNPVPMNAMRMPPPPIHVPLPKQASQSQSVLQPDYLSSEASRGAPSISIPSPDIPEFVRQTRTARSTRANLLSIDKQATSSQRLLRTRSSDSIERTGSTDSFRSLLKKAEARIDKSQVPRPDAPLIGLTLHTRSAMRSQPVSVDSVVGYKDTGSANPRFIRCTTTAPPSSLSLQQQTGLPIGLIIQPFAYVEEGDSIVPEVDFTDCVGRSPPRCAHCQAYINPFVLWKDCGNTWTCSLCSKDNKTPDWYYASLDSVGLRVDRQQRAELNKGSVDFIVGDDSVDHPFSELMSLFAVDISRESMARGEVAAALQAIESAVHALKQQQDLRVFQVQQLYQQQHSHNIPSSPPRPVANILKDMLTVRVCVVFVLGNEVVFMEYRSQNMETPVRLHSVSEDAPLPMPIARLSVDVSDESVVDGFLEQLPAIAQSLFDSIKDYHEEAPPPRGDREAFLLPSHRRAEARESFRELDRIKSLQNISSLLSAFQDQHQQRIKAFYFVSLSPSRSLPNVWQDLYGGGEEVYLYGESIKGDECSCIHALVSQSSEHQSFSLSVLAFSPHDPTNMSEQDLLNEPDRFRERSRDKELDIAGLGSAAMRTGGRLTIFSQPAPSSTSSTTSSSLSASEQKRLTQQILNELNSFVGVDAQCRLRVSSSMTIQESFSCGTFDSTTNCYTVPSVDAHSTSVFLLQHAARTQLKDEDRIVIQFAVLHSSFNSVLLKHSRRVRVHTLSLISSTRAATIYKHVDQEAIIAVVTKMALKRSLCMPLSLTDSQMGGKMYLRQAIVDCLAKYRKECSSQTVNSQLVLPESLKLLPLFVLGALKHTILVENVPKTTDGNIALTHSPSLTKFSMISMSPSSPALCLPSHGPFHGSLNVRDKGPLAPQIFRVFEQRRLLGAPVADVLRAIYPRVYSILDILDDPAFDDQMSAPFDIFDPTTPRIMSPGMQWSPQQQQTLSPCRTSPRSIGSSHPAAFVLPVHSPAMSLSMAKLPPVSTAFRTVLTQKHPCCSEIFENESIFLIDDGSILWLMIGRAVDRTLLAELFVANADLDVPRNISDLRIREDSQLGTKLRAFIRSLTADSFTVQELRVIWGESRNQTYDLLKFTSRLVEDSGLKMPSYVEFLCQIHERIQGHQQ